MVRKIDFISEAASLGTLGFRGRRNGEGFKEDLTKQKGKLKMVTNQKKITEPNRNSKYSFG